MELRDIEARDRGDIARVLESVGNFTAEEIAVALELVDGAIAGPQSEYFALVASEGDPSRTLGYVLFGPTPMTEAAWDLYWIAVDRAHQGRKIGKALLHAFEARVREQGGRIIRIETSSQESYGGTLEFYVREGYEVLSRVADFYKPGDDLITLIKRW